MEHKVDTVELKKMLDAMPNGFVSYNETFFEVVNFISQSWDDEKLEYDSKIIRDIQNNVGHGGLWELAQELTVKFEKFYKDEDWEEADYFETIDTFLEKELYE